MSHGRDDMLQFVPIIFCPEQVDGTKDEGDVLTRKTKKSLTKEKTINE